MALFECSVANLGALAADPGLGPALTQFLLLFLPLFLIWYFLVILPQQRQRKKTQEMLTTLKTGDRVITTGGIYGILVGFRNGVVQLQVAKDVKIEIARSSIAGLAADESSEKRDSTSKDKETR